MSNAVDKVQAEALELPIGDRARLVRRLLESLDEDIVEDPSEVEQAWAVEIERRVAEYRAGRSKTTPASEVFADARSRATRR